MIFAVKPSAGSKKRQLGVTLLEMLISLAIIAILLTVVAPNIQTILAKNRITANINDMSAVIQYARFSAIDQNATTLVCPSANFETCSTNWNDAKIVFVDINNDGNRNVNTEPLLMTTQAVSSQQYFEGPAQVLVFDETGATNAISSFKLCPNSNDATLARSVNVNQQGRTRISIDGDNDGIHEDANGVNLVCS